MTSGAHAADVNSTAGMAEAGQPADPENESIVVTGERYRINTLNSRLGDVRDAPQSISIIPREVIEQQAATNLRDVLRNVTGISFAAGEGGGGPGGDNLTLRGFAARNDIFVDGIRDFASYTRDTFNIEQVEVVKGPASAQTGRGSTGGYINLFTKQPQARTFVSGTVGVGLPGYVRATADINVGGEDLGLGDGVAARVNLLYHDVDSPGRDHVETQRIGIAPSVAFGLGGDTRAIVTYMLLDQDNVPDYGIPFVPATQQGLLQPYRDEPAPVDYDNYYGLLERDYEELRTNILTFALEHDLSGEIRLANTTRYGHADRDSIYSSPRFVANPTNDSLLINPQTQSRDTIDTILLNQSNIFAKFETGSLKHDLIGGFEISRERSENQLRVVTPGTPTDLFDPDPERPWDGTITDVPGGLVKADADTVAAYLFDTVHFNERFLFTGGIRWERYESSFRPAAPAAELERVDKSITWRAGLTYKPMPTLSIYAGAGTSVNPSIENLTQTTPTAALAALKPERSQTFELGAKWDPLKGKLLLTGAIFRTNKKNARTPGTTPSEPMVLEGKQRVDGIEFGATGWVTERWQLIAAYTYLDTEILESNTASEVGNRLGNVPEHSGTFWSTYKLPVGLELGGGARYVGTRYTNVSNVRRLDPYWLVDATAAYDISEKMTVRAQRLQHLRRAFRRPDQRRPFRSGPGPFSSGNAGLQAIGKAASC